jgi:tRNA-dihydrouridine synthase B
MLAFYGSLLGAKVARKHLGWYMDTAGTPPDLRGAILTAPQPSGVLRLLPAALDGHRDEACAA